MLETSKIPNSDDTDDCSPGSFTPIAVCGMALRLPGGISNPAEFWEFLLAKGDARSRVPRSRYDIESHYSKFDKDGLINTEYGYYLDYNPGDLDTSFFSFTKAELEYIDPHQRHLLEVVKECFDSAGEANYRGKNIGCYVGSFSDDWTEILYHDLQMYGKYPLAVGGDFAVPNRISFEYDLRGPSMSVRTACSSAMVALDQACGAMARGECDAAIVGGAQFILSPTMTGIMSARGVLSADGACKSFDAAADGYGRGEAINAVYLKPLAAAVRDRNPIRAIIRGSATNSDGKSAGFTVPSSEAQQVLIKQAYQVAGIKDLSQTPYVECHGTGTSVGDPIEAMAVAKTVGEQKIFIGSVKPNVGHSEGASGLTSFIKVVLALENRTIPPNIRFTTPNPKIPFRDGGLTVPTEPVPWPGDRFLRAGVNSFGLGGVNVHTVLESADSVTPAHSPCKDSHRGPSLLCFSANTPESLAEVVKRNHAYLELHPESLPDLAYTLAARRAHLPFRAVSIVSEEKLIQTSVFPRTPAQRPDIVFVFTGQGAQWPGMGVLLYEANRTFRRSLQESDRVLRGLPEAPPWSIVEEIHKLSEDSNLHKASYSQPICTAIQVALVDALSELNVIPAAVLGHSSGELAAAYAAGKLTAREAMICAFYRGLVSEEVDLDGAMCAVGMGTRETLAFLRPGVVIACENSPDSVTISGNSVAVGETMSAIQASHPGVLVRRLRVDTAYHSPHMVQVGERYRSFMDHYLCKEDPDVPPRSVIFASAVRGRVLPLSVTLNSEYWQENLESPVRFLQGFQAITDSFKRPLLFLELGPHSALAGPIRQMLDKESLNHQYLSCLSRSRPCDESFLTLVGELFAVDQLLDFHTLTDPDRAAMVLHDVPTYAWHHPTSTIYEPRSIKDWKWAKFPRHELLGTRVTYSTDNQPSWRNVLFHGHVPWLQDHRVTGNAVFPAAGYIAMAIEAVRQVDSKNLTGFQIRHIQLSNAMVLDRYTTTEVITSLRKRPDEDCYDFNISSHNGAAWVENCSGQVRRGACFPPCRERQPKQEFPRKIDVGRWYRTLSGAGVDYGASFQGLESVRSSASHLVASTHVGNTLAETAYYPLHPTKLDACFQTVYAARYQGLDWKIDRLPVPTEIREVNIADCSAGLECTAWAKPLPSGVIKTRGEAFASDGTMVLSFEDTVLSPVGTHQPEDAGSGTGTRLHWGKDFAFLSLSDLVLSPPGLRECRAILDQLTNACVKTSIAYLEELTLIATLPHIRHYHEWLRAQQHNLSPDSAVGTLEEIASQAAATSAVACAQAMVKVVNNFVAISKGEVDALELLMSDNTLLEMYNYLNKVDRGPLFRALGHHHPGQRILEIGAGTGGTTAHILSETKYSTYTFTDISAAFFPAAKERFKAYPNMFFKTLDITSDPVSQGFQPEAFDLIIASNVLHATPSLHDTLVHVRRLLHPQGKLLLEELCGDIKYANIVTGVLPGWWAGAEDGRASEPYVGPMRWEQELQRSGYNGLDDLAFDTAPPFHNMAYMLASPRQPRPISEKRTVLLSDAESTQTAILLQKQLRSRGYAVGIQTMGDSISVSQDVIVVVDTAEPFFHGMNASELSTYQAFLRELQRCHSGALWVTRCSQMGCTDPRFATTIGIARTSRAEFGIDLATCEVDTISYTSAGLIIDVFDQFQERRRAEPDLREMEYVIYDSSVYVGRLLPFSLQDRIGTSAQVEYDGDHSKLVLDLNTWDWVVRARGFMLEANEIEVEVDTAGLGCLGTCTSTKTAELSYVEPGCETAGIVRRVGSQVTDLSPGDRVIACHPGALATSVIVPSESCIKIPDDLSLENASALPLAFASAIYSLIDVGQLNDTQTILIHSMPDGVGDAAIQISKMLGAKVYVNATNEEEAERLGRVYGISRDMMFDAHSSLWAQAVKYATGGRGVDLVFGSLSMDSLAASCECLAPCGKLINLAGFATDGHNPMPAALFKPNISFVTTNLLEYMRLQPVEGKRLLARVVDLYTQRHIHPLSPVKIFSQRDAEDCLRLVKTQQYVGKLAISFTLADALPATIASSKPVIFRSNASYLLAGGLGGLGSGLARWMVEHGAQHLIFLSRSAGTEQHEELFSELKSQGCSITAIQGSVCNLDDIDKAIVAAPAPVRGIFNISMVLSDASLLTMSLAEWAAATAPKVTGTWNLHEASRKHGALDFFVLFSSMCGIVGMPGQANYAAANSFMDAFVQYRHHHHLPASVIDIGAVENIGHVANNPQILDRSKWLEGAVMSQRELFQAITLAILSGSPPGQNRSAGSSDLQEPVYNNPAQIIAGFHNTAHFSEAVRNRAAFLDRRWATYSNEESTGQSSDNTCSDETQPGAALQRFVSTLSLNDSRLDAPSTVEFLAKEIARWIFDLLLKPVQDESEIDLVRSLVDIGFDSLAAVELRSWWKAALGLEISVLEIMSSASLAALGEHAVKGLQAKFQSAGGGD
ncbi:type I polyketide synthase [Aspergillus homomorphus CBS 101889]|uniref:KR domain-containing protein n=1 Tax=Aspergillus homomorphus (strain CBS 101889) TaxID=1450537 RepID=A0A395I0K8_ASPHC|nr:KR domain-containing protein [Aspergillus homomorphus CBS 101889]RAL13732.1 KR domain-containing protein [Aspergillus homomorphus CBS 101889]